MNCRTSSCTVALVLLVTAGCAASNPAIDIQGLASLDESCMASSTSPFLGTATLDTSSAAATAFGGPAYTVTLRVQNGMVNNGNGVWPLMANANDWQAEEAWVELRDTLGAVSASYRVPAVGYVPAAPDAEQASVGLVTANVIPAEQGAALVGTTGTLVVSMSLVGTTSGDSTQQTGDFEFALTLCNGCLFQCVVDPTTGMPIETLSCRPGQDRPSDVCF
jgi:hypothetical protein